MAALFELRSAPGPRSGSTPEVPSSHATGRAHRARAGVAIVLTALVVGPLAGCGPSDDEIRADVDRLCDDLTDDLEELEAEPSFGRLVGTAEEARTDFGAAAFRVDDIADTDEVNELAAAIRAVRDAYDDLHEQITRRQYESLAATRQAGEAAIAAAVEAAEAVGATRCGGISTRVAYFELAEAGGEVAAAAIAPTGDYVTDVNAACARYADDTAILLVKLNMQSFLAEAGAEPSAGDYVAMIEDLIDIHVALEVLIEEVEALAPPPGDEAAHAALVAGFEDAIDGFRQLGDGDGSDLLLASVDDVDEAAAELGVECSVLNPLL
jgi:hypothetical protein